MTKKSNMIIGVLAAVAGIIYAVIAIKMPSSAVGSARGHTYMPLGLGAVMALAGIALFITEYLKLKKEDQAVKEETKSQEEIEQAKKGNKLIIQTISLGLAYSFLFDKIGYILSTILFSGTLLFILRGKEKWKSNLLIPIIFSLTVDFVFENLLSIYLP